MALVLLTLAAISAPAATFYVNLAGIGGELDYTQRFKMWADDIDGSLKKAGGDSAVNTMIAGSHRASRFGRASGNWRSRPNPRTRWCCS